MSLEVILHEYNQQLEQERAIWTFTPDETTQFGAEMVRISSGFETHIIGRPTVGPGHNNNQDIYEAVDMGLYLVDGKHRTVVVQPERQVFSSQDTQYTLGLFVPTVFKPGVPFTHVWAGNSEDIGHVSVSTAEPMERAALARRLKFGRLLDQVVARIVEVNQVVTTT